jgi:3-phosphoshikimate 1-carboxyvinyltransferase
MKAFIEVNNELNGRIIAPPSKSYSHRAFIAASLAEGVSIIHNPLISGDVNVTLDFLKKLGVTISKASSTSYTIKGLGGTYKDVKEILDCKNSGTTLRIFSTLALIMKKGLKFQGEFLKKKRPILPLLEVIKKLGVKYKLQDYTLSIKRTKNLCDNINLRGDISSQFITALLMVCPILKCKSQNISINVTTPMASYPYIKITLDLLAHYRINIQEHVNEQKIGSYLIPTGQKYRAQMFKIPCDFSSISYIIAAGVLSRTDSQIIISEVNFQTPQGDKKIIDLLRQMGAHIEEDREKAELSIRGNINKHPLNGINIDVYDTPDLFPILAVIGAFAKGKTTLYNASNLRLKESDRIFSIARELKKMGVKVEESDDKLIIYHSENLKGIEINHESDHRIAMAIIVAALYADTPSKIDNVEIIKDSYPNFFNDLIKIGANISLA